MQNAEAQIGLRADAAVVLARRLPRVGKQRGAEYRGSQPVQIEAGRAGRFEDDRRQIPFDHLAYKAPRAYLIDAAIFGFAVGTGFATIENLYYLERFPDVGIGMWIVRGFGTALMHGGCTAIFAMISVAILERARNAMPMALVPGFVVAVLLHSAYNHMYVSPKLATAVVIIVLPPLLLLVFQRSEKSVSDWLGEGFDADTQMLEAITSGRFVESPAGRYLSSIKHRFKSAVVGDLLCYIRLHTELALRAKGMLLMRENGFDISVDDETRAKLVEMRYLKRSIGKTGMLAMQPMLYGTHKDIWQLNLLDEESETAAGKPSPTD